MGYIGNEPSQGSYSAVTLSGTINGSNAVFTMSHAPTTARNLLVWVNGVVQIPDSGFSVSGLTLTFSSPPASGSVLAAVLLGHTYDIGKPSDGTVVDASYATTARTLLRDADNNTKVQVEESADENIIRFDTAGTERMIMTANGSPAVHIKDATRELKIGTSGYILDNESGDLVFRSNSDAERLRIKDGGSATGQFVARAWCRYNGTGTAAIDDSHNASSLTDHGTGDQQVNWSITMGNTNYCAIGLCGNGSNVSRNMSNKAYATTSTRFMYGEDNGTNQDMSQCNVVIFGD